MGLRNQIISTQDSTGNVQPATCDADKRVLMTLPGVRQCSTFITNDSAIYNDGEVIGGKLTLTGATRAAALGGVIQSVVLTDGNNVRLAIDLWFFNQNPTNVTLTDHTAFNPSFTNDLNKIVGKVAVAAADYVPFSATAAVACKPALGIAWNNPDGTSLYAVAVARGVGTWTNAQKLNLRVSILGD